MPTMDLDASVQAIFRRDPRFRPEAYHFLLEALDHTLGRGRAGSAAASASTPPSPMSPSPGPSTPPAPPPSASADAMAAARGATIQTPVWNVTGRDLLEGFRDLALERYGALAREVLRTWGITKTGDVGAVVFNLVESGLLQKTSTDSPADYHEVFDFESAFDRAFADRLRKEEVRLADRPPG
jgi:uncharacterized repeat protein (TIGR04138 family)